MDITVIIPTYNRATQLTTAIQSVLAQTATIAEIIVIDDGSTDDTAAQITAAFPSVIYRHQPRRGVSAARNHGIRISTQPWIALLDSDDTWHPTKIARQQAALTQSPQYQFCHTDEHWYRHGKRVNPMKKHRKPTGDVFSECLALCCISPSCVLIHRDLFTAVGLFDESLPACEDYDLWLRIAAQHEVLLVNEALTTKQGGHDDQLSLAHWGMDRFRIKALVKLLKQSPLTTSQKQLTQHTLTKKMKILIQGAIKHANTALLSDLHTVLSQLDEDTLTPALEANLATLAAAKMTSSAPKQPVDSNAT